MAEPQPPRELRVAPGGDGEVFPTVQAAVDAVEVGNQSRVVIRLAPAVYRETVYVAKKKNFITMVADAPESTVVSWDNTHERINHSQSAEVVGTGTFGCGTFIVEGEDFIAENITFENAAPQGSGPAVALRVSGDRCAFYNCRFLGWQDTLYLHRGKHYLRDCYIEGSVDFIFGNSIALLEHCHIHCKAEGFVTAHKRQSASESTGYVFLRCVITGNGEVGYMFLGRPWGPFGRVLFAYTSMDHCIKPVGWHNWDKAENEGTACFYEYRSSGPGAPPENRVPWSKQLPDAEAEEFLAHKFIDPDLDTPWLLRKMAIRIPASA
ncbi:hypothetical protein ACP70R_043791 [Stipagrostis hirtigluma subsp. patula]